MILLILSSALLVQAGEVKEKTCKGRIINNIFYEEETLLRDLDRPFLLAMDHAKNTLYFSYLLDKQDYFVSVYLNLNTKELGETKIAGGFSHAVDQVTHEVYIGTDYAIYTYEPNSKKAKYYGARGVYVWSIYFNGVLYYTDLITGYLYAIVDGESMRVKELEDAKVKHFIIDEDVIVYNNDTGLYRQKMGTKDAVLYQGFPADNVRGITKDVQGKIHVCVLKGVYAVDKETATFNKLFDLDEGFGIAFDKDNNFIHSDGSNVYRLKPNRDLKNCRNKYILKEDNEIYKT